MTDADRAENSEAGKACVAELGAADVSLALIIIRIMRSSIMTNIER